jgi:regulatory protein
VADPCVCPFMRPMCLPFHETHVSTLSCKFNNGNMTDNIKQALDKLRQLCSRQEKCPAEVIVLLKRWGIDDDCHQGIMAQLKSEKYLDENRYASAFVKDKIRFDHWGIIKIRYHLQQKGITKDALESAVGQVDRDEYRHMIGKELDKKRKSLKGKPREIWAKLARYGSSRGYEFEMMQDFLNEGAGD